MTIDNFEYITTEETKSEIIVFASAKGGVGKTVLTVNMAVAIASKGFSTCIIDGNFQFGDVNLALNIEPKLTISDVIHDVNSLDSNMLLNYLQNHDSGVKILSAPLKPEYADLITSTEIKVICKKLLEQHDYLIVDLSSGLSENNISFLELADKIFLVTDLEMAALKNTKIMLKTLNALNLSEKIRIIVNRGDMESVIKFKDVKDILGMDNLLFIPNNFKVVSKSFNIGIPFVINKPKEKISNEIINIASEIYRNKYFPRHRRRKKQSLMGFFKRKRN
ncbi:AAA family ATPase [Clostridium ganghwense]|uniref:AAA family ATPase n=1 Tax=Clostridium ganghwense TaxID=312089 RepID=A0ABT4CQ49_9CLOT|nr:AAA family ATPase [Clostridium ganghwense]MCY6371181.1 AAA family ATPase [Clostridium ganghwense]